VIHPSELGDDVVAPSFHLTGDQRQQ
jgi:hypothetical protein